MTGTTSNILPVGYSTLWVECYTKLGSLSHVQTPRLVNISKSLVVEILGFADAPGKAYAAVIFLKIIDKDGVNVTLQRSKTRVELSAAHLLAKLVRHYLFLIPAEKPNIHLWSNSKLFFGLETIRLVGKLS